MGRIKKYLPWAFRIIICLLFITSGIAKMFPIWAFEKQLVDLGIADWCTAPYFARLIIALEVAISVAILQRHFIRSIVIPGTVLLLVAFNVHLTIEMIKHGPMSGSCGCFGQIIPMTPLEAFIKNMVAIGLLVYLFFTVRDREKGSNKFIFIVLFYVCSALLMFVCFPFCPCSSKTIEPVAVAVDTVKVTDTVYIDKDEIPAKTEVNTTAQIKKEIDPAIDNIKQPNKVRSRFAIFNTFGGRTVNLDEGKKILCFFAPGCEDCQNTAIALCQLANTAGFPDVYILFMDEEANLVPDFLDKAQCEFPYKVIDIPSFWQYFGANSNTPGVFYLWNGNIMRSYEGTENNRFDAADLKKACSEKY